MCPSDTGTISVLRLRAVDVLGLLFTLSSFYSVDSGVVGMMIVAVVEYSLSHWLLLMLLSTRIEVAELVSWSLDVGTIVFLYDTAVGDIVR